MRPPTIPSSLVAGLLFLVAERPAAATCTAPQQFQPPVLYTAGVLPREAQAADLNGDGILDLAVPNSDFYGSGSLSSVTIHLGNGSAGVGNGTFAPAQPYGAGDRPASIAIADLTGDGRLDLAVANWGSNDVSVLRGNGNGTFAAPVSYFAGSHPFTVVVGDWNADGKPDLAACNNGTASVSVLLNSGTGTFGPPTSYPIADLSTAMIGGDFNEDGKPDLMATCNYQGKIAVLLGNGNGTFAPAVHYPAGIEPFDLAAGDFDEDGVMDVAVGNGTSGGVVILRGNGAGGIGNGTFGAGVGYGPGINASWVTAADVDQDGILDLAVSWGNNSSMELLLGQGAGGVGNGSFGTPTSYPIPGFPIGSVARDFNGDGKLDLAVATEAGQRVAVLIGTCQTVPPQPEKPRIVSVRDVRNDQGGTVLLRWIRSSLDGPDHTITDYRVWRRAPAYAPALAGAARIMRLGSAADDTVFWEAIATLPAQGLVGYAYTAPTLQDSMPGSNPFTAFFVTALTNNPAVFYESNVDSGYSVDNLSPPSPSPFVAQPTSPTTVALHWGASSAPDLYGYRLHRGGSADFVPSDANLIAAQADTGYVDASGSASAVYKLTAVDVHGNQSPFASAGSGGQVSAPEPSLELSLRAMSPTASPPGAVAVSFSLPDRGRAVLELLDTSGRRIASRDLAGLAGFQKAELGERLAPGIYFVRLGHGGRWISAKAIVLR